MRVLAGPRAPLVLDRLDACVHQGRRRVELTPKAFAVLCHLMDRPGRLVTKDELLSAVWSDAAVTEASVAACVREIRRALGDDPSAPRYIQTVHRRGYRYTGADVATGAGGHAASTGGVAADALLVGRGADLT